MDEFTIQEDGYAKGYPNDSFQIRQLYRTAHGLLRQVEDADDHPATSKRICTAYRDQGSPPLKDGYAAFIKGVKK